MTTFEYMLQKKGGNIYFDDYGVYFMPKELYEQYSRVVISVADVNESKRRLWYTDIGTRNRIDLHAETIIHAQENIGQINLL